MDEEDRWTQLKARILQLFMYLTMPSYAEPYKHEIKHILQQEKKKLCNNKTFKNVFENVDFSLAFANSKNIKQMVVRKKLQI